MEKEDFNKLNIIQEFTDYIKSKNYSNNTYISYINDLYYFHEYIKKDLIKVNENDIRSYLEYLNTKKEKATSVRRKISSFKTFYKFLYLNNYIHKKDYPLVKIAYPKMEKKLPKFIYYNDLLDIIKESEKDTDGIRDRLIIEMLYATGVRVSELINIKYENDYGYVFTNYKGEQITDRGIRYIIDNIMKRLSVKVHVTPHVLRHTFATDMLNNGCDIKVVQELLGHSSLKTTEVYTHVTNERLKQVYYNCFPRRDKDE